MAATYVHMDGLVQERYNSSALAMEVRLFCTNPLMWNVYVTKFAFHIPPIMIVTDCGTFQRLDSFGCYDVIVTRAGKTFQDAYDHCVSLGAKLVNIETVEENVAIETHLDQNVGKFVSLSLYMCPFRLAWCRPEIGTLSALLALCEGIRQRRFSGPKSQWYGLFMFHLLLSCWTNNRPAGDLSHHDAHVASL